LSAKHILLAGGLALTILGGASYYVGFRLLQELVPRLRWAPLIVVALVLPSAFASFAVMFASARAPWHLPAQCAGFLVLGFLSLLFAGVLAWDLLRGLVWTIDRISAAAGGIQASSFVIPQAPAAKLMLANTARLVIVGLALTTTIVGYFGARAAPRVVEVRVPVRGLPPGLDGFRIAQLSDLHVSGLVGRERVADVVRQTNELGVHMVAITGDLVDGTVAVLRDDVAPLGNLQSTYGTFFVTGNHEYYSGIEEWVAMARSLNMNVLLNQHKVLEHQSDTIIVGGVTDSREGGRFGGHQSNPARTLEGAPEAPLRIMLAHQPESAYAAIDLGYQLTLCGHSHAGQFHPWNLVVGMVVPFAVGLHEYKGMHVYTNPGTFFWGPPVRTSRHNEITLLILEAK
jgi:uncharacterized protein